LDLRPRLQAADIGVSAVANSPSRVRWVLEHVVEFLDRELVGIGEIVDVQIEIGD